MNSHTPRALSRGIAAGLALALLLAAAALAAGALKGKTYRGSLARNSEAITLKVAKNGKTVAVSVASAPLYCQGGGGPTKQLTKPAAISKSGSFSATIGYEFTLNHTTNSHLIIKGRFAGSKVSGSARSEFKLAPSCDGSTSFSAKAK
jgi:opacity protein-like surface antigen